MKDIQGIQRGKCNVDGCECEEYRTTPEGQSEKTSGRLRCEYCDHAPVRHVKIIELGYCKQCGKDNCEKYEFEDPNKYSDCAYCDCPANQHEGAEKLRKPQSQPQQPMGGPLSTVPGAPASGGLFFQPRLNAQGQPSQSLQHGPCKCPGCTYPRRVEGGKIHDFCSKTCAKKYSTLQQQQGPSGAQYPTSGGGGVSMVPMYTSGYGHVLGTGGQPSQAHGPPTTGMTSGGSLVSSGGGTNGTGTYGPTSPPVFQPSSASGSGQTVGGSGQPSTAPSRGQSASGVASKGLPMCKKCGKQPPNPGHSWCQSCFSQSS